MKMKTETLVKEHEQIIIDVDGHGQVPEAVIKDLIRAFDKVDMMSLREVKNKLKCFHLDTQGSENNLRENLKTSYKKVLLAGMDLSLSSDLLPYYVVIDFEATCDVINSPDYRHEIIEFPAILVNSKKQQIVDSFQMYCKPQINPTITEFCTELTGITQEQVDSAETFDKVFAHFQNWLSKHKLGIQHKFTIVTDGPWDMSRFLYSQCHYSKIQFPKWGNKWVNLKKAFSKFYKLDKFCLTSMLDHLNMEFVGRHHCGLDDAKNIARILLKMIYDGANIQINERIAGMKKYRGKVKGGNSELLAPNKNENEQSNDHGFPKVEAHYKSIYYVEQMPVYKRMRRERLIAETQLARKILRDPNGQQTETTADTAEHAKKESGRKKTVPRC